MRLTASLVAKLRAGRADARFTHDLLRARTPAPVRHAEAIAAWTRSTIYDNAGDGDDTFSLIFSRADTREKSIKPTRHAAFARAPVR